MIMTLREAEPYVESGRLLKEARRKGGASTARLSADERHLVVTARDSIAAANDRSKAWAAKLVAAQLRTGTFSGVGRVVDYSDDYVARLKSDNAKRKTSSG